MKGYMLRMGSAIVLCMSVNINGAHADKIFLHNGDRLSGVILPDEAQTIDQHIILRTPYGSDLNIPMADIAVLKNDRDQMEYIVPDAMSEQGSQPVPAQPQIEAAIISQASQANVPTLDVIEPAAGGTNEGYNWSGSFALGGSLQDGNSQKKSFTADIDTQARDDKNRFKIGADAALAEDEGDETVNKQTAYAEYDRFITAKWFAGVRTQLERDKINNLEFRGRVGPFIGYQVYDRDDLSLSFKAGLDYLREDFENDTREESLAANWGTDYEQSFWGKNVSIFHNHDFLVPTDDSDAFLFQSESGVKVPVAKMLTGSFQVDFDWDNQPAVGIREADTTYGFKLGYEWE